MTSAKALAEHTLGMAFEYQGTVEIKVYDRKNKIIAYSKARPGDTIEDVLKRTYGNQE